MIPRSSEGLANRFATSSGEKNDRSNMQLHTVDETSRPNREDLSVISFHSMALATADIKWIALLLFGFDHLSHSSHKVPSEI